MQYLDIKPIETELDPSGEEFYHTVAAPSLQIPRVSFPGLGGLAFVALTTALIVAFMSLASLLATVDYSTVIESSAVPTTAGVSVPAELQTSIAAEFSQPTDQSPSYQNPGGTDQVTVEAQVFQPAVPVEQLRY
jgi:hypothetical protein